MRLQDELDELRRDAAEAERQRDVAMTAMYSALATSKDVKAKVMELYNHEEERSFNLPVSPRSFARAQALILRPQHSPALGHGTFRTIWGMYSFWI